MQNKNKIYPIQSQFNDLSDINLEDYKIFSGKINYFIAITQRVGSSALCSYLDNTQLIGKPYEYFNPRDPVSFCKEKFQVKSFKDYLTTLIENLSSNKHFGFKISWNDFAFFSETGLDKILFKDTKIIFLDRENIIEQTISSFYAAKTKQYHFSNNPKQDIYNVKNKIDLDNSFYNFDEVYKIMENLLSQKHQWLHYFNQKNLNYLFLKYEGFKDNMQLAGKKIIQYLGIDDTNFDYTAISTNHIKAEKFLFNEWVEKTRHLLSQKNT